MRVCLISREYPPLTNYGGIATFSHHLAAGLVDLGHEVDVLSLGFDQDSVQQAGGPLRVFRVAASRRGINIWHLPLGLFAAAYSRAVWRKAQQLMKAGTHYDVIDTPDHLAEGFFAARARRLPLLVRLYTPFSLAVELRLNAYRKDASYWVIRAMEKSLVRRADVVTAPSANLAGLVRDSFGLVSEVPIVPNPIDTALFRPRPELAPHGSDVRALFVGRLEHRKGCQVLAGAIPQVLAECPEVRFTLLGADTPNVEGFSSMKACLLAQLHHARCVGYVKFRERVTLEELASVYCEHEIVVVPSLYDNSPYTCLEAMACGKAVVGTTAGGMPEYLDNGRAGLLVAPGDHKALAQAIVTLARDKGLRERLGRYGRERAERLYARREVCQRTAELYAEAIHCFSERGRG